MPETENGNGVAGNDGLAEYVDRLQVLAGELEGAIEDLAARRVDGLEKSVERQQALCRNLAASLRTLPAGDRSSRTGRATLPAQVCAAAAAVDGLNRRYAALLRHCNRSLRMWAALEHGHPAPAAKSYPSWSWEG